MGEVRNIFLSSQTGDEEEGPSFEERTERKGWAVLSLRGLGAGGPVQAQLQLVYRHAVLCEKGKRA